VSINRAKLIIYGNGAVARMVYELVRLQFEVKGFTLDRSCIQTASLLGLPLLPFDDIEQCFSPQDYQMLIAVGYGEMNVIREDRSLLAKEKGYKLANFIHSSVQINPSVSIGENNILLEYVSVHPFSKIGNNNFISSNSNIGHDCIIGNNCWINAGVSIAGGTEIKDNCFFGVNASAGHKIIIAKKTFVAANTFVATDTLANSVILSKNGERLNMTSERFIKLSKGI